MRINKNWSNYVTVAKISIVPIIISVALMIDAAIKGEDVPIWVIVLVASITIIIAGILFVDMVRKRAEHQ